MAKVYSPPADMPPPRFDPRQSMDEYDAACDQWVERLRLLAKQQPGAKRSDPALLGQVVRFHVADGYAQYLVWQTSPLTLVHLPLLDGYSIPAAHARGLRVEDIRSMIERDLRFRELHAQAVASRS